MKANMHRVWLKIFGDSSGKAEYWFGKKQNGLSEKESRKFDKWLRNEENREAYFEISTLWYSIDLVKQEFLEISEEKELERTPLHSIVALCGVGAFLLIVLVSLLHITTRSENNDTLEESYQRLVEVSGYKRINLPDGSNVELKQSTKLRISYTETSRNVFLYQGEAYFEVSSDPVRPFVVHSMMGKVRAVGTAFSVKKSNDLMEVWVVEGKVNVMNSVQETDSLTEMDDGISLVEGQKAINALSDGVIEVAIVNVSPQEVNAQLSWKNHLIEFDSAPLYEIVAEFNRLSENKIFIKSDSMKTEKMSVIIRADNYEDFLEILKITLDADIQRVENLIYISEKNI